MRTLKFIVDQQILQLDPNCDFDGLVPGTEGYLDAEFTFSDEWRGCKKVVAFWCKGKECPPQELKDGKTCHIPDEALIGRAFKLQIIGASNNGLKLTTNKVVVNQKGSAK